jgi:hypothetical protein
MEGIPDCESVHDPQHDKIELLPQGLPFVSYTRYLFLLGFFLY